METQTGLSELSEISLFPKVCLNFKLLLIEQIVEHLDDKYCLSHRSLGFHRLDPSCDNCLKLYSATNIEFNDSNLGKFANDLSSNFRKLTTMEVDLSFI